jgi:murein tripeptide amidase MpaA
MMMWYIAYFAPYSYERHLDLIAWAQQSPLCQVKRVCQTVDGRDLDVLQIGEVDKAKKVLWMIARQHPGEAMAEWFIEGFLSRLLDVDDPVAQASISPGGVLRGAQYESRWCSER